MDGRNRSTGSHFSTRAGLAAALIVAAASTTLAQCDLTPTAKLLPSDPQVSGTFGLVAISGDWMAVSSPGHAEYGVSENGNVAVYRWDGVAWNLHTNLTETVGIYGRFGSALDLDDDLLVVGQSDSFGAGPDAVWVYRYDGTAWQREAQLMSSDWESGDQFGCNAVSISGDRFAVGAHSWWAWCRRPGKAYVFRHDPTGWVQEASLRASDAHNGDNFGTCVELTETHLIVGAPQQQCATGPGAAYVFRRDGTSWLMEQKLTAPDGHLGDEMGGPWAVAMDETWALVGAECANSRTGKAYLYRYNGTTWDYFTSLFADDGAAGNRLGRGVSLEGDRAWVAAAQGQDAGIGALYQFRFDGISWTQVARMVPSGASTNSGFASEHALHGDQMAASAFWDDEARTDAGAVYWFDLTDADGNGVPDGCVPQPCDLSPAFQVEADRIDAYDNFGGALAADGDWLAVGLHGDDPYGHSNAGSVALFRRDSSAWAFAQKLAARSTSPDSYFGSGVAIDDQTLVVAQYHGDEVAHVYRFDGSVWRAEQRIRRPGPSNIAFSWAIDLRGDRIVVGAPDGADGGAAFLFERSDGRWHFVQQLGDEFVASGDSYGAGVTSNDQHIVVAARWRPYAIVFQRTDEGWTTLQILEPPDTNPGETMVWTDTIDMNDEWLVIGSADGGPANEGRAYVYRWDGALWQLHQTLVASDAVAGDGFGVNVLLRDDTLVVGAHRKGSHEGGAYLFHFDGVQWSEAARLPNPGSGTPEFGRSLAMFGEELLVGALFDDDRAVDSGAVYGFDLTDSDGDGVPDECDAD